LIFLEERLSKTQLIMNALSIKLTVRHYFLVLMVAKEWQDY